MKSLTSSGSKWGGVSDKPALSQRQWNMLAVPAIVLALMAILQLISFGKFKDWLDSAGIGWPSVVALVVIIAELLGSLSLLQVGISRAWRWIGLTLGVVVTGFWFILNITQVTNASIAQGPNSGFFGNYLKQAPSWWTVLEISILLFWVIYSAELLNWRSKR